VQTGAFPGRKLPAFARSGNHALPRRKLDRPNQGVFRQTFIQLRDACSNSASSAECAMTPFTHRERRASVRALLRRRLIRGFQNAAFSAIAASFWGSNTG
jgi:hypothetical protein